MAKAKPPVELGKRGLALWRDVTAAATLGPLELALLVEACRTVDVLDNLARVAAGKGEEWVTLAAEVEGRSEVAIVVDSVIGEARQQRGRLAGILGELRQRMATPATGKPSAPPAPAASGVPTGVASILGRARTPRAG